MTKRKFPLGTTLLYHPAGLEVGAPCEIVGFEADGRYAVKRTWLSAAGEPRTRVTHVSEKTLTSREYSAVKRPPECWRLVLATRLNEIILTTSYTPRVNTMDEFRRIEREEEAVAVITLESNYGEQEIWDRFEGTGIFTKRS